jgi:hypothetical protein
MAAVRGSLAPDLTTVRPGIKRGVWTAGCRPPPPHSLPLDQSSSPLTLKDAWEEAGGRGSASGRRAWAGGGRGLKLLFLGRFKEQEAGREVVDAAEK